MHDIDVKDALDVFEFREHLERRRRKKKYTYIFIHLKVDMVNHTVKKKDTIENSQKREKHAHESRYTYKCIKAKELTHTP